MRNHFGSHDAGLASHSNGGVLMLEEAADYDSFLAADDVLSLWQCPLAVTSARIGN
jgi:hypothetical protein